MKTATAEETVHTELGVNTQPAQRLVLDFIFTLPLMHWKGNLAGRTGSLATGKLEEWCCIYTIVILLIQAIKMFLLALHKACAGFACI